MQPRLLTGLIVCTALFALAGVAPASAADVHSFFTAPPQLEPGKTDAPGLVGPVDVEGLTKLAQKAASGRLEGPLRLGLDLAPDLAVTVEVDRVVSVLDGTWSLVGRAADDVGGYVILVIGDGILGEVLHHDRAFAVRPDPDMTLHRVVEVQETMPIAMDPSDVRSFADARHFQLVQRDGAGSDDDAHSGSTKTTAYIDLLVVYDTVAPNATPTWGTIDQHIAFGVTKTNLAFTRSQVDAEVRLVHVAPVDYTSQGNLGDDLAFMVWNQGDVWGGSQPDPDGVLDVIHAMRDAYGADLVHMLVYSSNPCGIATLLEDISFPADRLAFSISSVYYESSGFDCTTNHSFTHELGHTLGCGHALGDGQPGNPDTGYYDYSHGHRHVDSEPEFRTVMAYAPPTNGAKLNFSNPDVDYCSGPNQIENGSRIWRRACAPTGVAGEAENARTMEGPNGPGDPATKDTASGHRLSGTRWADLDVYFGGGTVVRGDDLTVSVGDLPLHFQACNSGSHPLVIDNYYGLVEGSRFSQTGPDPPDYRVNPNACWSFWVDFDANGATGTSYPATVTLFANDSGGVFSFDIDLQLPPPEIRVTVNGNNMPRGGTFTFPTKWVGDLPISQAFAVCNDGAGDLVISNPTGLVSGTGFTQIDNPPITPLGSGQCTSFRVRFHVATGGSYSGTVSIHNNDSDENPYSFQLQANASTFPID